MLAQPPDFAQLCSSSPRDGQDTDEAFESVVRRLGELPALRRRTFLLAAMGAIGLAACSQAGGNVRQGQPEAKAPAPTAPRRGGTYRAVGTSDAVTLHPFKSTDSASSGYQGFIYSSGMVRYDPITLDHVPNMAEKWEISADKLTYNWYLRKDINWSDGKPLTSEDWLWTFQQAAKPENKFPYKTVSIDPIAEFSAPEPYRLVVRIKEPIVPGIEQADPINPLPKHIWEQYDWNDPAKNPEIMSPSVASGMYKLKEWKRDDYALFEANDSYWEGRPYIDQMLVRIVPEASVSYQMLKNGEIDSGIIQPGDFEEAKANPNLKLYTWDPAIASWEFMGFNLRRPLLKDAHVRRAISYATRREALSQVVWNNLAKPTFSIYPPTSWVYNPNVPKYDYDPKKAAEELEAAGWKLPTGGKVREKDGQQLKLKLLYGPNTSKTREQTAVLAQQWLADIGIELSIQAMEWGAFLQATKTEPYDWDVQINGWRATLEPHWMFQIWSEDNIPELNSGAYVNKHVEDLFDQASKEFDRDQRKKLYQEIQQIVSSDAPYVFTVYQTGWTFLNKRVHPNEPTALGIGYEREKWWLEE